MTASSKTSALDLTGPFYQGFRGKVREGGVPVYGPEEQTVIQETVEELLYAGDSIKPGMLLGKIQSGKTKTFLGAIALGFDNGFDIAVVLTKPTTALARQTYKRVTKEFCDFIDADQVKVYDILELPERLTKFELNQKLIFIVKKQSDNLNRLSDASTKTYPMLAGKKVLIVDDEADNASIGYFVDKTAGLQLKTIADQVDNLRNDLDKSEFLQVTATPYSLYLQPDGAPIPGNSLLPLRPRFTKLVPVHPDYVGGDFYFEESKNPAHPAHFVFSEVSPEELAVLRSDDRRRFKIEECLTSPRVAGLRKALMNFVTAGCLRRIQDEQAQRRPKRFAFLFHTEAGRAAHAWQETVILRFDELLKGEADKDSALLRDLVKQAYEDLSRSVLAAKLPLAAFDEVYHRVRTALSGGELMITKVNSEAQVAALLDDDGQLKLRTPLNIFIGGQILDRGITIANLIGFFYGRDPKKFQMDTVLQHSRMYGFRPLEDRTVTRFYTAIHIHRAMRRMHEADSALRERIASRGDDQRVNFIELAGGNIIHCSPAKILASNITTLRGHRRLLPIGFQTDYAVRLKGVTDAVDDQLRKLKALPNPGELSDPKQVSLDDALKLLELVAPTFAEFEPGYEDTWNLDEYKAILRHLCDEAKAKSAFLLVRTDRNLSRTLASASHAEFSDAPDTTRTEGAVARSVSATLPVLMLIRQNGAAEQGWRSSPFWWPVLLTPANTRTTLFAQNR
jgi:hypothetical protein